MRKTTKIIWFGHRNQVGLRVIQRFKLTVMKKYFSLLIMTFVSIITNAQTSKLLMNDAKSYIGKIDDKAKMNVGFYSVF